MRVKSLSACIKNTVDPRVEILSPSADKLRQSIIEKIPIFLHEFDDQRFRHGMRLLRWRDKSQFFVRACKRLCVTKRLEFEHAIIPPGREQHNTELSAETEVKDGVNVLWIKDPKPDSYEYVVLFMFEMHFHPFSALPRLCVACCSLRIKRTMFCPL
jgi:hypothetical protein